MRQLRSWAVSVLTFLFIAAPCIAGLFFAISFASEVPFYWMVVIAIGVLLYATGFGFSLIALRLARVESLAFILPLGLVFALLFLSRDMAWWGSVLLAVVGILSALPVNMLVARYKRARMRRKKDFKV